MYRCYRIVIACVSRSSPNSSSLARSFLANLRKHFATGFDHYQGTPWPCMAPHPRNRRFSATAAVSVRSGRGIVRPVGEIGARSQPVSCHCGRSLPPFIGAITAWTNGHNRSAYLFGEAVEPAIRTVQSASERGWWCPGSRRAPTRRRETHRPVPQPRGRFAPGLKALPSLTLICAALRPRATRMTSPPSRSRSPQNVAPDLTTTRNSASSVDAPTSSALPSSIGTSAPERRGVSLEPRRLPRQQVPPRRPQVGLALPAQAKRRLLLEAPARHWHASPRHSPGWFSAGASPASRRAALRPRSSSTPRPALRKVMTPGRPHRRIEPPAHHARLARDSVRESAERTMAAVFRAAHHFGACARKPHMADFFPRDASLRGSRVHHAGSGYAWPVPHVHAGRARPPTTSRWRAYTFPFPHGHAPVCIGVQRCPCRLPSYWRPNRLVTISITISPRCT